MTRDTDPASFDDPDDLDMETDDTLGETTSWGWPEFMGQLDYPYCPEAQEDAEGE